MANKLKDVMAYLCLRYPHKDELSKARFTKLVYLADWKSALDRGVTLTDIEWVFDHFGPFVHEVFDLAKTDPAFKVDSGRNMFGSSKETVSLRDQTYRPQLTQDEQRILDHIVEISAPRSFNGFIQLVYSTYPVLASNRYEKLDLVRLAAKYKREMAALGKN